MSNVTTKPELLHSTIASHCHLFDDWFDPIEAGIRERVRGLIEEMIRGELATNCPRMPIRHRRLRSSQSVRPIISRDTETKILPSGDRLPDRIEHFM
jgi:hypothetical protein